MNLTKPSEVAALLQLHGIKPNYTLGQNFLIDANILRIIIDAADIQPTDVVFEVGPGLGVLTAPLLERAAKLIAVEKDSSLIKLLKTRFADEPKLELIHGDAMHVSLPDILAKGVTKFVSNLPYAIGTRLLVELFEQPNGPQRYVVTVQREVGSRLAAQPGDEDFGLLSLLAQLDHEIKVHKVVSAGCFFPPPQIKSAVVVINRFARPRVELHDRKKFKTLLKQAFSQRRKQIATILHGFTDDPAPLLAGIGLDPRERSENIPIETWGHIANELFR